MVLLFGWTRRYFFKTNIKQSNLIKLIEFHMSKKMEKKLMIKFKYVFWIKYPWWTSKSKVNPLCFKFQSWCLKPRLIYAILLFSWPNSSLITRKHRTGTSGFLRQKIFDIKHLPASRHLPLTERDFRLVYLNFQSSIKNLRNPLLWAVSVVPYGNLITCRDREMRRWVEEEILLAGLVWWLWPSPGPGTAAVRTITLHSPEFLLFQTFGCKNWLRTEY